jgi:hypothetical protein
MYIKSNYADTMKKPYENVDIRDVKYPIDVGSTFKIIKLM